MLPAIALIAALHAAPFHVPRRPSSAQSEAGSGVDPALTDAEVQHRVDVFLKGIDTPVSGEQWRALGPRAVPLLEQVLADSDRLPSHRAKAAAGLGAIGDERAGALVLGVARSEVEPFGVRAAALRAAPSLVAPQQLAEQLKPVLERSAEPAIRATAAEALAHHAPSEACAAVRAQAERERERAAFGRALARCRSR